MFKLLPVHNAVDLQTTPHLWYLDPRNVATILLTLAAPDTHYHLHLWFTH